MVTFFRGWLLFFQVTKATISEPLFGMFGALCAPRKLVTFLDRDTPLLKRNNNFSLVTR